MEKMIRRALVFMLIMPYLTICSPTAGALEDDAAVVVAHGFGGTGGKDRSFVKAIASAFGIFNDDDRYAPYFPDAGGYYSRTVLYTKPAVVILVKQLNDVIQSGKSAIHLVAHSCGGGIAINMLAKLVHYEKNSNYFENTGITLEHAKAIMAALKKGSINITAPLLSAERSKSIIWLGGVLSASTCTIGTGSLYYAIADKVQKFIGPIATNLGFVGAGLYAYYVIGQKLKNMYIKKGVRYIMPLVSRYNFDPLHPTPLDVLEELEDGLITRLHVCAHDDIVDISAEDMEKLRAKAVEVQIVDDTNHYTIKNSLQNVISRNYCVK